IAEALLAGILQVSLKESESWSDNQKHANHDLEQLIHAGSEMSPQDSQYRHTENRSRNASAGHSQDKTGIHTAAPVIGPCCTNLRGCNEERSRADREDRRNIEDEYR